MLRPVGRALGQSSHATQKFSDEKVLRAYPDLVPDDLAAVRAYIQAGIKSRTHDEITGRPILPKDQLKHGRFYKGRCRNSTVARWNAEENCFYHWREKFGNIFIETIKYPTDETEPWWDVFDVVEELPKPKFEIPFSRDATFSGHRQKKLQCPHCDKTFAVLSGLASHLHYLHPDKPALERPGKQPRAHGKSGQAALPVVSSNAGAQEQGKVKKLMCAYCDKAFARPSSLSTHIRYRHPGKSPAVTALPTTTPPKMSAPAPAPVVAPNASVEEHLKTALQELTQRQHEIDEQLSRIETLQSEKETITKQIDAVNAALQAF